MLQWQTRLEAATAWWKRVFEKREPRCLECGDCCRQFSWHLRASERDLERWRRHGRTDLLERVNELGWIWVDPETKENLDLCPFLVEDGPHRAYCSIHEIKPDICREYPSVERNRTCLHGTFLS